MDCHMPETETYTGPFPPYATKGIHSHTFAPDPVKSCGLEDNDCHPNHKVSWAEKQIAKGVHDKDSWGQVKEK
jgi:hypothetical protein